MSDECATRGRPCGCSLAQIGCSVLVVLALFAILVPIFQQGGPSPRSPTCVQSLKQIGIALSLYVADNRSCYPTNRPAHSTTGSPPVTDALIPAPGAAHPRHVTYVKGLEGQLKQFGREMWMCPAAAGRYWPGRRAHFDRESDASRVSYAINYYLLEIREHEVSNPAKTLAFRELGLLGQSYAVPFHLPPGGRSPATKPVGTFLASHLTVGGNRANRSPHGERTNVLFVDGHVERIKNIETVDTNIKNNIPGRSSPYRWALCRDGDPADPIIWITP